MLIVMQVRNAGFLALLAMVAVACAQAPSNGTERVMYRYTDDQGTVHMTDNRDLIPAEYYPRVERVTPEQLKGPRVTVHARELAWWERGMVALGLIDDPRDQPDYDQPDYGGTGSSQPTRKKNDPADNGGDWFDRQGDDRFQERSEDDKRERSDSGLKTYRDKNGNLHYKRE